MKKERIAVRCPNMGYVSFGVTTFCCMLERISADPRCKYEFDTNLLSYQRPWDFARNTIVDQFLKGPWDRLWFLDSDILPSPASLQLLWVDADISAGPYPMFGHFGNVGDKELQIQWSVYSWNEEKRGYTQPDMPDEGVFDRDGAGTGMMIIRREVLEDPRMHYPREYTTFTGERRTLGDDTPVSVFLNKHTPNGGFDATEDLDFCFRAKKLGYSLKVDYAIKSGHLKQVDVMNIAKYSVRAYEFGFREALASKKPEEAGLIVAAH